MEELMKEFMPSPPKSSVVIEEIEDENAQPGVIVPKPRKRRAKLLLLPPPTGETTGVDGFNIQTVGVNGSGYVQGARVDRSTRADESKVTQEETVVSQVTQDEKDHPKYLKGNNVTENVLQKSSEFDDSFDEDYVVDQFNDDQKYCMDDYVVEEEVQVEHEVGNKINTECEPSVATSKKEARERPECE
ncbi:hypothetical protein M9H77_13097 [Catharanthus roseus]|uniref:Uncharacterized protein n=1 Tax=Catharanthus roseus TaxID=4058 RepID=A0ACC0BJE4_CATRO|nr:hypothetical protein M9H77_13097 [Catharanthus roseus]